MNRNDALPLFVVQRKEKTISCTGEEQDDIERRAGQELEEKAAKGQKHLTVLY